jgi:DNA polymerase-1
MRVVVIDAFSLIHRAYHAMPGFVTKTGEPSGAVYGFCSMFLKMVEEFSPEAIVACFDIKERTFRHELYAEYQAQRESKPDDFYSQVERVKDFLELLEVRIISFSGYDADDAIGSVAEKLLKDKNNNVVILSGDNDMLQLVKDRVKVFSLRKGITDTVIYDTEAVVKKYGFQPELLPDFKALSGDQSDNIPGVAGIGPKTATSLIQEHGSLENIFKAANTGKLKDSLAKKLQENKNKAFLFKDLATIRKNLDVNGLNFSFDKKRLNSGEAVKFFEELGFKSLLKRIGAALSLAGSGEILKMIKQVGPEKFLKTKSFSKFFVFQKNENEFLVSDGISQTVLPKSDFEKIWQDVLSDQKVEKVTFDLKEFLRSFEPPVNSSLFAESVSDYGLVWDVKILGWLADSGLSDYGLEKLSRRFLTASNRVERDNQVRLGAALEKEPGSGFSIKILIELFAKLSKISEVAKIYKEIEAPLISVLFRMEKDGILVDEKILLAFGGKTQKRILELEKEIFEQVDEKFNLNSPKELSQVIYQKLGLIPKKVKKLKSGYFSTDSESLKKIVKDHKVIAWILEWRELSKLMNTYVRALPKFISPKTKRLHTTFLQTGTATGRLASESPNLQNIPKHMALAQDLRRAFLSEVGSSFVAFDYSQIELRLAASLSRDKNMVSAFLSGQDIHKKTASLIWNIPLEKVSSEQRFRAKALNFGVLYGMGVRSLAQTARISQDEARMFIDDYFHNFPGLKDYLDKTLEFLRENGYVETVFGRRRYLPGIHSGRPKEVAQAERMALNLTLQGLAADIIKKAMIRISNEVLPKYKDKAKMILQIHDELLFEVKDEIINQILPEIKQAMENVYKDKVPLLVESRVGKNWAEVD